MTISEDRLRTILWLEFYGLQRMAGVPPLEATRALQGNLTAVGDKLAQFGSAAGLIASSQQSLLKASIEGIGQGGGALLSMIPVVGQVASIAVQWASWITAGIVDAILDAYTPTCTKDCSWPRSYERRNLIGVNPAPWGGPYLLWAIHFHDGLYADGRGVGLDGAGRVRGASERLSASNRYVLSQPAGIHFPYTRWGWNHTKSDHAAVSRPVGIPSGDIDRPWRDPLGETVASRAWRVESLSRYVQDALPCRHLLCLHAQLSGTIAVAKAAQNQGKLPAGEDWYAVVRRTGSRWAASVYWLHRDLWELAGLRGHARADEVLRGVGATDAAEELGRALGGKTYAASDLPWPWYPVTRKCNWEQLCLAVTRLAAPVVSGIAAAGTLRMSVERAPAAWEASWAAQAQQPAQQPSDALRDIGGAALGAGVLLGGLWLWGRRKR